VKDKRDSVFKRTIKTRLLYVPNTLDMFLDHVRVRGMKVSHPKGKRLYDLYRYFATEEEATPWPKDRFLVEGSVKYYKNHSDAVLDADIKLLVKVGVLQEAQGQLKLSFMDIMFGGVER